MPYPQRSDVFQHGKFSRPQKSGATDLQRYAIGRNGYWANANVKRIGPYRIFFYAGDRDEPQHVHVERDEKVAKFWLDPVRLQKSGGFSRTEISRIHKLIEQNYVALVEAWNDYFGS